MLTNVGTAAALGLGALAATERMRGSARRPLLFFVARTELVLDCDPLARCECTGQFRPRIKEGTPIHLPHPSPGGASAP